MEQILNELTEVVNKYNDEFKRKTDDEKVTIEIKCNHICVIDTLAVSCFLIGRVNSVISKYGATYNVMNYGDGKVAIVIFEKIR